MARCDYVFEEEFETSMVQAAYMESMGCIAQWDARGRVTVWTSVQSAFNARRLLALVLDVPQSAVVVKVPYVGGGFGAKIWVRNLQPITALLARKSRPGGEDRAEPRGGVPHHAAPGAGQDHICAWG